jgi:hypothetical protein
MVALCISGDALPVQVITQRGARVSHEKRRPEPLLGYSAHGPVVIVP